MTNSITEIFQGRIQKAVLRARDDCSLFWHLGRDATGSSPVGTEHEHNMPHWHNSYQGIMLSGPSCHISAYISFRNCPQVLPWAALLVS